MDLIYIGLLEAYQPEGISTNIQDIWSFEHSAWKMQKSSGHFFGVSLSILLFFSECYLAIFVHPL